MDALSEIAVAKSPFVGGRRDLEEFGELPSSHTSSHHQSSPVPPCVAGVANVAVQAGAGDITIGLNTNLGENGSGAGVQPPGVTGEMNFGSQSPPPATPYGMHTCEPWQIVHPMTYTHEFCSTMNKMYG